MRTLQIIDAIAIRALHAVPNDIAADLNEADAGLGTMVPRNLLEGMEAAAVALADQTFLDLFDAYGTGHIGDEFDFHGHYDSVMVSFANRMTTTLQFVSSIPTPWVQDCQRTIAYTYVDRVKALGMAGQGGFA